jgi:UDP-N-acetylmuramoylalanine--D-glutamate ligase
MSLALSNDFRGQRVTVMGLGLNGGGVETARHLVAQGATVTVTDLRDATVLAASLEALSDLPINLVLGEHRADDFSQADLVIKNPAVRPGNPFIALAKRVETDLSLFLASIDNPLIVVSGSKGKSTTSSAIHFGLLPVFPNARLGGNITISPLSFVADLSKSDPVVLEISSFQLGDLAKTNWYNTTPRSGAFPPQITVMTNLFADHQDYYGSMSAYLADKALLFSTQTARQQAIFRLDDQFSQALAATCPATCWLVDGRPGKRLPTGTRGAWLTADYRGILDTGHQEIEILPAQLAIIGEHQRGNLLEAAVALYLFGVPIAQISDRLRQFPGIEHRLELCTTIDQIRFVNDSAATIPEAALSAVRSFAEPVHLITGGTDKALSFEVFLAIANHTQAIYLLQGTATDKIMALFERHQRPYYGPFATLELALSAAIAQTRPESVILLSPGCASFGLFLNEFDRGRKFKAAVARLASSLTSD